jgi:hypothetical protein
MGSRAVAALALFTFACELPPLLEEPEVPVVPDAAVPDAAPPDAEVVSQASELSHPACAESGAPAGCASYGVPDSDIAGWFERSFLVALNGARAAPRPFRDGYMMIGDGSAPLVFDGDPAPRAPLAWHPRVAEAARLHADDRLDCIDTSHDPHALCDGTGFWTWIQAWKPPSITSGVAHHWKRPIDRALPLWFVTSFICDGLLRSDGKLFECVSDTSEHAGHRDILVLSSKERQLGAVYLDAGDKGFLSGETTREAPPEFPMVTAGHFYRGNQIVFAANVEVTVAPRSVSLIIGAQRLPLTPALGTTTRGMYARLETAGTACRTYHFELVDGAGRGWRYPARGSFRTHGEGSCRDDWVP